MTAVPVAQVQSRNTLLDYSLTTSPAPLQASADAKHPSMGGLTIVVSNSGRDVSLTSIEIALPVGSPSAPEGADLTEVGAGILGSISDSEWQVSYPGKTDGVLWVKPKAGEPIVIGDQGIAITITNIQVSTEPGTAFVTITEDAVVTETGAAPQGVAATVLGVPKFPVGFSAGNFSIIAPVISNGNKSTMTWYGTQSTGTTYTILWTGAPVDVSTVQTWTSPPLTDVTTFLLEVQAATTNGPVKLWFSSTQIVSTPSIVAQSLQVLGPSTLEGQVTAGPPGDLQVNGGVTATGTAQAATVTATTNFSGPSAGITAVQTGTLNVATSAVFAPGSTLGGALNAMGASVAALANAVYLGAGPSTYVPNTDGFIVGAVAAPPDITALCCTTITVAANLTNNSAIGGTMACLDRGGNLWHAPNYGTILLPVSKGTPASIGVCHDQHNEVNAPVGFAFVPMGSAQGETLITHVSDDQPQHPGHVAVRFKKPKKD